MTTVSIARRSFLKFTAATALLSTGVSSWAAALDKTTDKRPDALAGFKGKIVTRENPAYLAWFWAMTWYRAKVERYPQMFAQPVDKADVALLVKYAKDSGTRMTVRSSGHNITMPCLASDAILIDVSLLDQIDIDKASKTGWVGPGATSEHINTKASAMSLSFPAAHTGFVSIGGFVLGGGMGWNMPAWGMAAGSILGAEVILADGRIVEVSASQEPDLYWAMRGVGPGFFAVVVRYKLQFYDMPVVVKNTYFFGMDVLEQAVNECVRLLPESRNRTEVLGALGTFNPPGTPKDKQGWNWALNLMSYGATYQDALDAASVFINSNLPKLAKSNPVQNQKLTYMDMYTQLSTDGFSEFRSSEIALFTEEPAKALHLVADLMSKEAADPRSFGFLVVGTNPTVPEPCSFTYAAPHYLSWYLMADTQAVVEQNAALMQKMNSALAPLAKGYYMNEIDLNLFPDLARKSFSAEKWSKLIAVRKAYDPDRRFHSYLDQA